MNVLILTQAEDIHALIVQLVLQNLGHQVRLLHTRDQPTHLTHSLFIANDDYRWEMAVSSPKADQDYDVVWWRRAQKPYIPKNKLHSEDYIFAKRENDLFFESLTNQLSPQAWWINPKLSASMANDKWTQLKKARDCGLEIPPTLCSNNVNDLRDFINEHEQRKNTVICKPLCTHVWFEEDAIRFSYTRTVTAADFINNDEEILQLVPVILQEEMIKKYELRITCFGDYLVAAKINSQMHSQSKTDWRALSPDQLAIEPYVLPLKLESQIRKFMKSMNLVFGAIDMIVTKEDEYIFLEVNEQGQFLWLENCNPAFKMLDIFVGFILNKSAHYFWNPQADSFCLNDYKNQALHLLNPKNACAV